MAFRYRDFLNRTKRNTSPKYLEKESCITFFTKLKLFFFTESHYYGVKRKSGVQDHYNIMIEKGSSYPEYMSLL